MDHSKNGLLYSTRKSSKGGYACFGARLTLKKGRIGRDGDWLHSQGLDGRPQKIWTFDVGIFITQKMVCHRTRKSSKWGVCTLWGSLDIKKWVGLDMIDYQMHSQGLNRRPQKLLAFLTSKSGLPKKWFAIAHENHRKWRVFALWGSFDLKNGSDFL